MHICSPDEVAMWRVDEQEQVRLLASSFGVPSGSGGLVLVLGSFGRLGWTMLVEREKTEDLGEASLDGVSTASQRQRRSRGRGERRRIPKSTKAHLSEDRAHARERHLIAVSRMPVDLDEELAGKLKGMRAGQG